MPVYQFVCSDCHKLFEKTFSFQEYGAAVVGCPFCNSNRVRRSIKNIRVNLPDQVSNAIPDDPAAFSAYENDPQAMGRMMRKMSEQSGEEFEPEFHEVVDRLEKGQSFEQIEKELPDIDFPADTPD